VQTIGREHHVFSYSAGHEPVAKITPGQSVLIETTYAFGDQPLKPGDSLADIDLSLCDPLTGPLYVETAEPGDTLAIHVDDVEPTDAGAQGVIPDFGVLAWDRLPLHFFTPEGNRVTWLRGLEYEMRPNVGAIGVAPETGEIPSVYPGDHGGNMDMKHIRAGATVLLPVWHRGAILFVGDCHQRQGDGELPGCVAETNAKVTLNATHHLAAIRTTISSESWTRRSSAGLRSDTRRRLQGSRASVRSTFSLHEGQSPYTSNRCESSSYPTSSATRLAGVVKGGTHDLVDASARMGNRRWTWLRTWFAVGWPSLLARTSRMT
jgi:hypothetical protein